MHTQENHQPFYVCKENIPLMMKHVQDILKICKLCENYYVVLGC